MSNRLDTRIILGSQRYKSAINVDSMIPIPLNNTQKELDEFDRSNVISLAEVFDEERQGSDIFRLSAKIDLLLFNAYSGVTSIGANVYQPFANSLYYVNSEDSFSTNSWSGYPQYVEFDLIRNDYNVPGYTVPSGSTQPHVDFKSVSASTYNWTQYVSYPYENDYNKLLQYDLGTSNPYLWNAGEGRPFYIKNPYSYNGQTLISFISPVEHGLTVGEWVEIEMEGGWNGYEGNKVFQVYSVGNGGYNSDKYVFNIFNNGFTGTTFINGSEGNFKRIIDITNSAETMSKYYVRKHKIITNVDEAILTKAAFDLNGFNVKKKYEYSSLTPDNVARITYKENNQSYLLSFSKDIDIRQYRDNLNRPLTKLFITIINKGYFGWMNKEISNNVGLREGYKFNLGYTPTPYWRLTNNNNLSNIPLNFYTKPGSFTFYYNQDLKSGDTISGDYCEYNEFEQKERVVSEFLHKLWFNPFLYKIHLQGTLNPDGYYYQPHHPITLKIYSDYLEEGEIADIAGVPDYAYYSNYKSKLIWRDIYTYGFIDESGNGVDYPFLNGAHYPSTNITFRVFPEGNVSEDILTIADPIIDDCE